MHPYLPYLFEDIAVAYRSKEPDEAPYTKTFEEEMEEIERWCEGEEYEHTFGYYCGLKAENFPPAEQLTIEEIEMVNEVFRQMMFTYNQSADFPKTLPPAMIYSLLVNTLNEKTFIPSEGFVGFDYCTGYAPDCIFKEYCACLEFWNSRSNYNEDISISDSEEGDFPF